MKNLKKFKLSKLASRSIIGGVEFASLQDATHQKTYAKSDPDHTGPSWKDTVDE